jgi:hypothetical protein
VTFFGDWIEESSDCTPDLDGTVWTDATTDEGYTTVYLSSDLSAVDAWVVHEDAADYLAEGEPSDKFYISDMDAPLSGGLATYQEDEEVRLHGIYYFATLSHDLQITLE